MSFSYAEDKFNKENIEPHDDDSYFEPDFLEGPNKNKIDLSKFDNNQQLEGDYFVGAVLDN